MNGVGARLTAIVLTAEAVAWVTLVPGTLMVRSFAELNVVFLAMFAVGFASAAKGLPALSIAQTLHQVEHPAS